MAKLFLPNVRSKIVKFGQWEFWGENGVVWWQDIETGKADSMLPERAIKLAAQLGKSLGGSGVSGSACRDTQDRKTMMDALAEVEQIAKDQLEYSPMNSLILP